MTRLSQTPLTYWDQRWENDRQFSLNQQKLDVERALATSLGGLQGAQANDLKVRAGLAPKIADSEIGLRKAATEQTLLENSFYPRKLEAELALTGATIRNTDARTRGENANAGLTQEQANQIRRSRIGSSVFQSDLSSLILGNMGLRRGLTSGFNQQLGMPQSSYGFSW